MKQETRELLIQKYSAQVVEDFEHLMDRCVSVEGVKEVMYEAFFSKTPNPLFVDNFWSVMRSISYQDNLLEQNSKVYEKEIAWRNGVIDGSKVFFLQDYLDYMESYISEEKRLSRGNGKMSGCKNFVPFLFMPCSVPLLDLRILLLNDRVSDCIFNFKILCDVAPQCEIVFPKKERIELDFHKFVSRNNIERIIQASSPRTVAFSDSSLTNLDLSKFNTITNVGFTYTEDASRIKGLVLPSSVRNVSASSMPRYNVVKKMAVSTTQENLIASFLIGLANVLQHSSIDDMANVQLVMTPIKQPFNRYLYKAKAFVEFGKQLQNKDAFILTES